MPGICKHRLPFVVHNVRMVDQGRIREGALLVEKNGRIEQISDGHLSLDPRKRYFLIDGNGQYLLPGVIDTHVHFRDPGFTHKGDIETESRAAVAGGVTSFCDMPNTKPLTITREVLRDKYNAAAGRAYANYAFYLGASQDNLDEIRNCDPTMTPAIKLFMGASTGNMQLTDPQCLEALFRESPLLIAAHCETDAKIEQNLTAAKRQFPNGIPFTEHAHIRSTESCVESVKLAQQFAINNNARLHVLHLSAEEELALFRNLSEQNKGKITCETCPHYLYFSDEDYDLLQWQIKCNPAIKGTKDRAALIQAIQDGTIQTIGTDHAPHLVSEKLTDYLHSPSGIPSIQYSLVLMLELARREHIPFSQIVELMCHAPSRLFGVVDRGYLREGYFADLVFVAESESRVVNSRGAESRCEWSPYDGYQTHYFVRRTIVNGQVAYCYIHGAQDKHALPLNFNANRRDGKFL